MLSIFPISNSALGTITATELRHSHERRKNRHHDSTKGDAKRSH